MTFTATVFQYIMWFSYPWGPIIMYPAGNFSQRPYAE